MHCYMLHTITQAHRNCNTKWLSTTGYCSFVPLSFSSVSCIYSHTRTHIHTHIRNAVCSMHFPSSSCSLFSTVFSLFCPNRQWWPAILHCLLPIALPTRCTRICCCKSKHSISPWAIVILRSPQLPHWRLSREWDGAEGQSKYGFWAVGKEIMGDAYDCRAFDTFTHRSKLTWNWVCIW